MDDIKQKFVEILSNYGFTIPAQIYADGKKHRFSTNKSPKDTAGEYCLYTDNIPSGYFVDYRSGVFEKFRINSTRSVTVQKKHLENLTLRKQHETEVCNRVAHLAKLEWDNASSNVSGHPYLIRKNINGELFRIKNNALLVPVYKDGEIISLQKISASGGKKFKRGSRVMGGYVTIGENKGIICLCEGVATGISIHDATKYFVVITFNCFNLNEVSKKIRDLNPQATIIICADNDIYSENNRGLTYARSACEETNALLAIPNFDPETKSKMTDFNDLYNESGSAEVKKIIDKAILDNKIFSKIELTQASDIIPTPIEWIWKGWIAKGKLHIMAGMAGTGKTTAAMSFTATISRGALWPDQSSSFQAKVLIWSGEDGIEDTLYPRLLADGANTDNIYFIQTINTENGTKRQFDPSIDIHELEENIIKMQNVAMIIIDPIVSVVKKDSNSNGDVRRGLQPLIDLAIKYNIAIIGISHFSKGTSGKIGLERVTGSLAFGAAARVVFATAKITDDTGKEAYVLAKLKSNLGEDQGGFYYQIQQCNLTIDPAIETSKIEWGEEINGDATYLLSQEAPNHEKSLAKEEAKDFLREQLSGGIQQADEIFRAAETNVISKSTLKRAKKDLGIISVRVNLEGGKWAWGWQLPDQELIDSLEAHEEDVSPYD